MDDWGEFVKSPVIAQINNPDEDWGDFVQSPLQNTHLLATNYNDFNFQLFSVNNNNNITGFISDSDLFPEKSVKNGEFSHLSSNSDLFSKKSSDFDLFGSKVDNNGGVSLDSDLFCEKSDFQNLSAKKSNFHDLDNGDLSGLSSDSDLFVKKSELKSSKSDLFAQKISNFDFFAKKSDHGDNKNGLSSNFDLLGEKNDDNNVNIKNKNGLSSNSDLFGEKSDLGNLSGSNSNFDFRSFSNADLSSNSDIFGAFQSSGNGNLSEFGSNSDLCFAKSDLQNIQNGNLSQLSSNSDLFAEKGDIRNVQNGNISELSSNSDLFAEKSDFRSQNGNISGLSLNYGLFGEKSDFRSFSNGNLSGLSSNSDLLLGEKSDFGNIKNRNSSALSSDFGLFGEKSDFRSLSNGNLSGLSSNFDLFLENNEKVHTDSWKDANVSDFKDVFQEKTVDNGIDDKVNSKQQESSKKKGVSSQTDSSSYQPTGFSSKKAETVAQNGMGSDSFINSMHSGFDGGLDADDSNEWFGNFQGASTGNELKEEGNETKTNINNGALPLALFGDEELETDDSSNAQDGFSYKPSFTRRDGMNSQGSSYPINDLISDLYSQAQQYPSVENQDKLAGNGLNSNPSSEVLSHIPESCDVNSDDDSWEFKDASAGTHSLELSTHLVFYRKLEEELSFVCRFHLHNLKKARDIAAFSGEDEKVRVIEQEIQDACKELEEDNSNFEILPENQKLRDFSLDVFLEVLEEPKFKVLESQYQLSRKLHLAQNDLASAIEAMKHTKSKLNILTIGSSEEQFNYVSTWCRIINVCTQELKHGSWIWNQTIGNNFQDCIISEPRGKDFILSLGEIYKVAIILRASAKLYEPWVLSNTSTFRGIFSLLEECRTLWSSLRIEEALEALPVNNGQQSTAKALLKSIKHIQEFDDLVLQELVFGQHGPMCRLSLLSSEVIPDMKMVSWNGETYFVTLANLWVNLISCDLPTLPHLQVGS